MLYSVIGLAFGDEGKGRTVAALTEKINPTAIVRFSGGSQAAHRVVKNGKSHIFAQFGSGSAVSDIVETWLSSQMVIDPLNLLAEAEVHEKNGLGNLIDRLHIDPECPIITLYNVMLNRAKEISRGDKRFSTTGLGTGETIDDLKTNKETIITAKDLLNGIQLRNKLLFWKQRKYHQASRLSQEGFDYYKKMVSEIDPGYFKNLLDVGEILEKQIDTKFKDDLFFMLDSNANVIFEGSQGTMLDPRYGQHPYITKGQVTLSEVKRLIGSERFAKCFNIGVTRGYITRHGKGPLASESEMLTKYLVDSHNVYNEWQGSFRVGWLDVDILKYSVGCNKDLSGIVITCLDRLPEESYYYFLDKKQFIYPKVITNLITSCLQIPVVWESWNEECLGYWVF